jgi:D-erythrulose 1-phosphate 3-epimerase
MVFHRGVNQITRSMLGINNCFAVKRWTEPQQWARLVREELCLEAVQFSLDLVDLAMPERLLMDKASQIRHACAEFDILLHSVFTGLCAYQSNLLMTPEAAERDYWLDWYKKAVSFSAELGCICVGGHMGALTVADYTNHQRKEVVLSSFLEIIYSLSTYAKANGIEILVLECMPVYRELTATVADALSLHDRIREASCLPVGLCLDTGHQCAWQNQGIERSFYHWLEQLGDRVTMIHLQQNNGESDQHLPFIHETLETGVVEAEKLLSHLDRDHSPDLFLEIIPSHEACDRQVCEELVLSARYWLQAADKVFLK